MDPKTLEIWMRLAADALKGTERAQQAMESLGKNPLSPEVLAQWWAAWTPNAGGAPEGADLRQFQDVVEGWWKSMGVVPRHRYLELLERHEQLRGRLEEAERTVAKLRELLKANKSEEVGAALDSWEQVTRKVRETQEDWMRSWMEELNGAKKGEKS